MGLALSKLYSSHSKSAVLCSVTIMAEVKGKRLNFVTLRKRKGGDVSKRNGYKSH